ncbi:Hypothetical protein NGAL_HAMBI1145_59010 [Neorhizobium galegae bv. officinalis]|uniref:Uncharacterized protein n=1 Tax=Neorhizobium galegae bv. officinalis TaxID=323656 RepID=A0A0T7G2C3_NEOGA|nr:Hypothetical protein NGAL_HAMBI1145_59010 [Neorhizobium galegae bv. officinalis]
MSVIVGDPDRSPDATPIPISVVSIFRHGAEHHFPTGKDCGVGEAERNSLDKTKIQPIDSEWRDGLGLRTLQGTENLPERITDDRIVGMSLVAALEQTQLVTNDNRTFNIEFIEHLVKRTDNRGHVQFMG